MTKIYNAGHCLTRGSQMQRMIEVDELFAVNPTLQFYNPLENKEINDKSKLADDKGLAEKIVKHDTDAIMWSNTVVIEPLAEACGTMVELGQIKGMRDVAKQVLSMTDAGFKYDSPAEEIIVNIIGAMLKHTNRKVYPHFEDVRRVDGITETGDRRSLGINQYVYGVCLDLTDGVGFYDWKDIVKTMEAK